MINDQTINKTLMEFQFSNWYAMLEPFALKAKALTTYSDLMFAYFEEESIKLPDFDYGLQNSFDSRGSEWLKFRKEFEAILRVYGYIFPKLNWSSPQDAKWISATKTLKCDNFEDYLILLKSSNKIAEDIKLCKKNNLKVEIVLKKYYDLNPSFEFRCFIKSFQLKAISQRNLFYFENLKNAQNTIINKVIELWNKVFEIFKKNNYLSCNELSENIVMDIYVIEKSLNIKIVDINLLSNETELYLVNEEDLLSSNNHNVIFRCVKDTKEESYYSRCMLSSSLYQSQYPIDVKQSKELFDGNKNIFQNLDEESNKSDEN